MRAWESAIIPIASGRIPSQNKTPPPHDIGGMRGLPYRPATIAQIPHQTCSLERIRRRTVVNNRADWKAAFAATLKIMQRVCPCHRPSTVIDRVHQPALLFRAFQDDLIRT
ncbi:MAG: hypothetical protein GX577_05130 [Leptolinea sp.]|nr:hypothetical protein [Leptolinea sp.]